MTAGKKLTLDEVKQRIRDKHGDLVSIDESTYTNSGARNAFY
jgi:hypothetical protein